MSVPKLINQLINQLAAMLSNVNCTHSSMDQWPVARLKESIAAWISSHCVASSPDVGTAAAFWSAVSAVLIYLAPE